MRLSTALHYLRRGPFDLSTEAGRSSERYRLAMLSVLANLVGRGIGMVGMVLGVSWTVPYLGAERFGVWMTIASFSAMLTFLDLGIGNALTNHVAKCAAHESASGVRKAISGGLGFLALIGFAVAILLFGLAAILPWDRLLKASDPLVTKEAGRAAMSFGVLFGINIFTSGIQKVFAGLQRAFEAHATSAAGGILTIAGLAVATSQHADITVLLMVTLGAQSLTALTLLAVMVRRKQLSWQDMRLETRSQAQKLMKVSTLFLVLQVGTMIGWGADSLIVASVLGVAQVAVYGITQRLMQFVSIPLSLINSPLWAAYADAQARGDKHFMRRTLTKSLSTTLALAIFGVGLVAVLAQSVVEHWTQGQVFIPLSVVLIFGLWTVLETTGNAFAMFLNGCGIIRPQVISVLAFCALTTPLKFYLATWMGISGVLIATICAYLVAVPLLYVTLFRSTVADTLHAASRGWQ